MVNGKKYYITLCEKTNLQPNVDLSTVVGEIKFIDTPQGEIIHNLFTNGASLTIKPYGYGEKDKDGKIKSFSLIGFTITE